MIGSDSGAGVTGISAIMGLQRSVRSAFEPASRPRRARQNRLEDAPLLGRYPGQQLVGITIAIARGAPAGAVAIDDDAAVAGVGALGGAVRERIDKHQRVTGFHID